MFVLLMPGQVLFGVLQEGQVFEGRCEALQGHVRGSTVWAAFSDVVAGSSSL